jgi:hypothetical protein
MSSIYSRSPQDHSSSTPHQKSKHWPQEDASSGIEFQTGRPALSVNGLTLCGPMDSSCQAVSGAVSGWRPRHGPMVDFSGRASTAPRTARWATSRHGTIVGGVEAEAATPTACGGGAAEVGTAGAPAPRGASGQGRPELHPRSGTWRQSRGGRRRWRVEAKASCTWSGGGRGRRGGSSDAPRHRSAGPEIRPPRCARSGEDNRSFGPAAARRFGERSKGQRQDQQGAGSGICRACEPGVAAGWGDREEQREVRVVSKTRVSDFYM